MKTNIFKSAICLLIFTISFTSCKKQEKPFLTVDETPIEVTVTGGEYFITVKSSGEWTAMVEDAQNKDWCILGNNSGMGEGRVIVNIAENTDTLMRSAVVKITYGELVKSVLINQAGKTPFLTVDKASIEVVVSGGEYSFTVKSSGEWTAMVEDVQNKDWCTLDNNSGNGEGTVIVNITENTDILMRSAVVKITSGELVKSVLINQAGLGSPFLTVDERFIMMKFGRDEQFITVKSNRAWTATVENAQNRSWCTLSNSSGIGNGKITVKVTQNTEALMRGVVVKIISDEFIQSVLICQNLNTGSGNEVSCEWDYPVKPGMPEWAEFHSYDEMLTACQIPDSILNSLSTECLTKICLQYPLIINMFAFNYMRDGFNNFHNNFNGIRELYNREEVLDELLKQYHNLINDMSILDKEHNVPFIMSISVLEVLLYGYSQKVDASVENYKNILLYLTVGYEKKHKYEDFFQGYNDNSNYFSRANVIVKIKPESVTSLSNHALVGWILAYQDADIINELSYELIK